MNVPAIRAALERLSNHTVHCQCSWMVLPAVVRVGLRACDEWKDECYDCGGYRAIGYRCPACDIRERNIEVIADILREAGVEVKG